MPPTAKADSGESQEPGTHSGFSMSVLSPPGCPIAESLNGKWSQDLSLGTLVWDAGISSGVLPAGPNAYPSEISFSFSFPYISDIEQGLKNG